MRHGPVMVAAALLLAGCASGPESEDRFPGPPDVVGEPAENYLQIIVGRSDTTDVETYTLVCGDGSNADAHPQPEAACAHLEEVEEPFSPTPDDVACTQQYGGPQTASVFGRWDGEPVDLGLSRTDGCRIAQWDALGPLLPGPVG